MHEPRPSPQHAEPPASQSRTTPTTLPAAAAACFTAVAAAGPGGLLAGGPFLDPQEAAGGLRGQGWQSRRGETLGAGGLQFEHGPYYGPSRQVIISGSPVGLRTALRGVFAAPGSPRTGEQFVHSPSQAPPGWRRSPTALFRTDQDGVAHFDGFINSQGSHDGTATAHIQAVQQQRQVHLDLHVVGDRQRQLNEALQRARTTTTAGEAAARGTTPPDYPGPDN